MIHQDQQLVMMEQPLSMCWTEIASPAHPDWHRLGFPQRLYHLLNFMECNGLSHMACWGDKGTCFRIRPSQEVVQNILPYFFQQSKWKSFQRQINVYAFKRIRSGPYKGFYRHPYFSRNNVTMAYKLQRKKQRSEMPDHLPQGERDGLALPTAEPSEEGSLVGYGKPSINECCTAPSLMHHITSPALCSSPERDVKLPKQFQFFCQEEKQAHDETDPSGVDFEIGFKINSMAAASPTALHERSTKTSQPSSVFMSGGPFLASVVHNQDTEDHEVTKTNALRGGRLTTTELSIFANLDWTDVLDMDEIIANSDTCTGASSSSMAMVSATDASEMSSTSSSSWVDDDDKSVVTIDDFSDLAMLEKDSMFEPLDIFPSSPSTFGHVAAVHV